MPSGLETAVLLFAVLLLAALLLDPLARRLHLPVAAVLVLAGFLGSELAVGWGFDLGLRWYHFHDLVMHVLLPVLVFGTALALSPRDLCKHLPMILLLALPVFLLSAGMIAVLLYLAVGHVTGFPWLTALLAGVIIAATDPAAVVAQLRRAGVPARLLLWLEGESLFNDATAIVAYGVLLAALAMPTGTAAVGEIAGMFLRVFFGGALVGVVLGVAAYGVLRVLADPRHRAVLSVAAAYLAFALAETVLHVSGVMAVLVAGLCIGAALPGRQDGKDFVRGLWGFLVFMAEALAFLLVGVTLTPSLFTEQWLAMLLGIAAALAGRSLGIFACAAWVSRDERQLLIGGGLRGAVTAALALSLPVELPGWWTAQGMAYGVVLFTLFVQAPLLGRWLSRTRPATSG